MSAFGPLFGSLPSDETESIQLRGDVMRDDLENRVAQAARRAWQDALNIDVITFDDDFFELGGNSLSAVRLISMVRHDIERDLKVRVLLQNPTLGSFVRAVVLHITSGEGHPDTAMSQKL